MQLTSDPRRADRERRFKPPPPTSAPAEDLTTDYMNILGRYVWIHLNSSILSSLIGSFTTGFPKVGYVNPQGFTS